MLGAIIGDIVGSVYEIHNVKTLDFHLFTPHSRFTDDTVMTLAVAKWLTETSDQSSDSLSKIMQTLGLTYPSAGYGGRFLRWLIEKNPKPYGSWGNGSAMRVSPVGLFANSLEDTLRLAKISAEVSHNHPEGVKGAQAIATAIFLARLGKSKGFIRHYVEEQFQYDLHYHIADIRNTYTFDVSCQGSVPQAIMAFLDGNSFEEVIRIAISLGGDSDTIAAMAGSIAQPFYGIPKVLSSYCYALLTPELRKILNNFEELVGIKEEDPFFLQRFIEAQNSAHTYANALQEIERGQKMSHWIWYIFPQLKGLGHSKISQFYGLADQGEAEAFFAHPILKSRLLEISKVLLKHKGKDISSIMGDIDAVKLQSSMTLFDFISPNDIFRQVLKTFYHSCLDKHTLQRLHKSNRE